jgi:hypothetical protein
VQVVPGPVADPTAGLPVIALWAGRFEVKRPVKEAGAGEPRPQSTRQRVETDPANHGPFTLGHRPLPGTTTGRLVLGEGTIAERREPMVEGKDFTIDYRAGTVSVAADLGARVSEQTRRVASQIYARAGHPFNLDSPQELSTVLFDELKIPPRGAKNASGYYSTAKTVLEALAREHVIVSFVLAYRGLNGSAKGHPPVRLLLRGDLHAA